MEKIKDMIFVIYKYITVFVPFQARIRLGICLLSRTTILFSQFPHATIQLNENKLENEFQTNVSSKERESYIFLFKV